MIFSLYFKKCHKPVCKAATKLVNVYCTRMDEQRDKLSLLEMEEAMLMWDGSPISRQTVPGEVFSLLLPTHSMLASLLPACEAPRNGQDEGPHCAL